MCIRDSLGAADGDALGIAVDHAGGQEGIGLFGGVLGAVGLRIDDDIGQIEIVVPRIGVVVGERLGAVLVVSLEHIEAHIHAGDAGGDVVGRAAQEPGMQAVPGLQRAAAHDQVVEGFRQLPDPVGASARRRRERHQVAVLRSGGEIEQLADRLHRARERWMARHVIGAAAVDEHGSSVAKPCNVRVTGFHDRHAPCCVVCLFSSGSEAATSARSGCAG